eukprot:scaffold18369_cov111-Isochrysis_galbana.AAC.2
MQKPRRRGLGCHCVHAGGARLGCAFFVKCMPQRWPAVILPSQSKAPCTGVMAAQASIYFGTCAIKARIACAFGPHGSCGLAIIFRHAILALSIMLQLQAHGGGRGDALGGARPRETRARKPRREKISRIPRARLPTVTVSRVCALVLSRI